MMYRHRPLGLFLLLVMIFMGLQAALKKPICIESNLVNKIDRLSAPSVAHTVPQIESIYACRHWRAVVYSRYFSAALPTIERRIVGLEIQIAALSTGRKINIEIDEIRPQHLAVTAEKIEIGIEKLQGADFETAVVKAVLLNRYKAVNEKFIDFVAAALSEHKNEDQLFTTLWHESINSLSVFEKIKVKRFIVRKILQNVDFNEPAVTENIATLLKSAEDPATLKVRAAFSASLRKFGLVKSELNFDVIIEEKNVSTTHLEQLKKWSRLHPQLRVGYQSQAQLLILPYLVPVAAVEHDRIKTDLRLRITEASCTNSLLRSYADNTEHLIVISVDKVSAPLDFSALFAHKISRFLAKNNTHDFIQFHMPSVKSKLSELIQVTDYFEFLKGDNMKNFKQNNLGWASVDWHAEMQAFRPVAIYDAIQFYRVN